GHRPERITLRPRPAIRAQRRQEPTDCLSSAVVVFRASPRCCRRRGRSRPRHFPLDAQTCTLAAWTLMILHLSPSDRASPERAGKCTKVCVSCHNSVTTLEGGRGRRVLVLRPSLYAF